VMERAPVADLVETPRHPYTMGLVDSVSSLESGRERLSAIPGNVPNPLAMPPGCPFAPRCQQAMSKCQQMPPIQRMEDSRHVACWLY
jgi:oligopeptide/dipeptide ABC transporter ATP-binding protein